MPLTAFAPPSAASQMLRHLQAMRNGGICESFARLLIADETIVEIAPTSKPDHFLSSGRGPPVADGYFILQEPLEKSHRRTTVFASSHNLCRSNALVMNKR